MSIIIITFLLEPVIMVGVTGSLSSEVEQVQFSFASQSRSINGNLISTHIPIMYALSAQRCACRGEVRLHLYKLGVKILPCLIKHMET